MDDNFTAVNVDHLRSTVTGSGERQSLAWSIHELAMQAKRSTNEGNWLLAASLFDMMHGTEPELSDEVPAKYKDWQEYRRAVRKAWLASDDQPLYKELGYDSMAAYCDAHNMPEKTWRTYIMTAHRKYVLEFGMDFLLPFDGENRLIDISFVKLYIMRKVVTPDNVHDWLARAAILGFGDLVHEVKKALGKVNDPTVDLEEITEEDTTEPIKKVTRMSEDCQVRDLFEVAERAQRELPPTATIRVTIEVLTAFDN